MNYLNEETSLHYISNLDDPNQFIKDYNRIVDLLNPIEQVEKQKKPLFNIENYWCPVYNNTEYSFRSKNYQNDFVTTARVEDILKKNGF